VGALDVIKRGMYLLARKLGSLFAKCGDETLETAQPRGIDARRGEAERAGEAVIAIEAGVIDRHETDVRGAAHAKALAQQVHRATHTPCARTTGKAHEAHTTHHRSPLGDGCVGDDHVLLGIRGVVVPGYLHVVFSYSCSRPISDMLATPRHPAPTIREDTLTRKPSPLGKRHMDVMGIRGNLERVTGIFSRSAPTRIQCSHVKTR